MFDTKFLDTLINNGVNNISIYLKGEVSSVCQLQTKSGLLFDTFGNFIPCNAMFELKLGKYGVDFIDGNSLIKHMDNNNQIQKIYNRLCGLPSLKCLDCKKVLNCGG